MSRYSKRILDPRHMLKLLALKLFGKEQEGNYFTIRVFRLSRTGTLVYISRIPRSINTDI
jgi:hypothetical protein